MTSDATLVQPNLEATEATTERAEAETPDMSAYGGSYYATTHTGAPERPALRQDIDVDICVIGGGLAGLTTARVAARKGWSVAVLEGKRLAWNASGRNTGFVLPGFGQEADQIVARVGEDHARSLWALSQAGLDYVKKTITENALPGIEPTEGWLHVSKANREKAIADEVELLQRLGGDVEAWPTDKVRERLKSDSYFQAVHYPGAINIHPLNYALGLARLAEEAGARIFENTEALSIDPAGVRKRVVTANGRVRAAHIVLAGNVHLGPVMPSLSDTLLPIHTYVIVTKPLDAAALSAAIDYPGSVSDTDRADNHYRIIGGNRLMWSGRMTVWEGNPGRYVRSLLGDIRRRYPQLPDVEAEYAWGGVLGLTVHRMPQIGEFMPGVWIASGFGGHGLNTTAMAGNMVARAITDGDDRWRLFRPFELVYAGGSAGRIIMQGAYWAHRLVEGGRRWLAKG
jgi:gamma-glutamylputrescine oxidase